MKKVYAKFLTMLTVMSLAPVGAAMAADTVELPVEFELGESISISLSSSDLKIVDLLPGEQKNSNVVTVRVSTNNASGYTLSATVGSSENESKNLINVNTTDKFAMVSGENQALSDSTWGYSLGGASATTFSTLPLYTETAKVLSESSEPAADDVPFVIGARAKSGMSAGGYTNVINFVAVTKAAPEPIVCNPLATTISDAVCMQDMNDSIKSTMVEDQQYQLYDERDEKAYWVAKLVDDNVWMTQNLDYDIKAIGNEVAKVDGTTTTWDANPTYTSEGEWDGDYTKAESYDPGDNYIPNGTGSATSATSLATNSPELHYHQGNYYNWYAATAGSNADDFEDGEDAPQSICPKGWRLPYSGYQTGSKSWYYLVNQAGLNASNITASPVYISYSGSVSTGSFGSYWSSTANGWGYAYFLSFDSSFVLPQIYDGAGYGYSVRCVAL